MPDIADMMEKYKVRIKNALPNTKWPLEAVIFGLHNKDNLHFQGLEQLRPYVAPNGDYLYIMRSSNKQLIPPEGGIEDIGGAIVMVQVGDDEYRYATLSTNFESDLDGSGKPIPGAAHLVDLALDKASKELIFTLKDDEQFKILYAKATEEHARRTQAPAPWWQSAVVAIIAVGVAVGLTVGIGSWLGNGDIRVLTQQMQPLTDAVSGLTSQLQNSNATQVLHPPV